MRLVDKNCKIIGKIYTNTIIIQDEILRIKRNLENSYYKMRFSNLGALKLEELC